MSYRSRRSRCRKKAGIAATKREQSEVMRTRYYLTKVKRAAALRAGAACEWGTTSSIGRTDR